MSDLFRIPQSPAVRAATLQGLVAMCHDAEEIDDDVTFLQVMDEVARREKLWTKFSYERLFREEYLAQGIERYGSGRQRKGK